MAVILKMTGLDSKLASYHICSTDGYLSVPVWNYLAKTPITESYSLAWSEVCAEPAKSIT